MPPNNTKLMGTLAAAWGVLGVLVLLGSAIFRLSPIAWSALSGPLQPVQYAFVVGWVLFMAYGEGYRGFQRAFSPRVVARAAWLRHHPTPMRLLLAPAFCMGFFHATRKRLLVSWIITVGVVVLIVGVKFIPDPWRGLVDAGVVVGLSWGLLAIVAWGLGHLVGRPLPTAPDVPVAT
ncbi:MAG: hypothetical protein CL927_07695 [Deltaproteobacteria bacterium]|nr:hypothetical protein [Deltaproteobacteria bacterium]